MEVLRLGEFAEVSAGNSAPQNDALFKDGTLPFVRTSDVGAIHIGTIQSSRDLLTPEGAKGLKLFPAGTILFPKSGASTFLNHRVILNTSAYVSSHLATIKAKNDVALDSYIFYFLQTIDARDLCQDQSYPSLNRDQIAGIKVALPPLDEQQRIVEKLDSAFAEIDHVGESITTRIKNASELFAEICLTKTQDLKPTGFESLKEIATVITKGTTPTSLGFKFTSSGINFLKVESLDENGGFIENKFAFIDSACHESLKRSQLVESDVLVSIAGALGRTAIVTSDVCPANVNQALSIIRLPKDAEISPNFLIALFQSGYFKLDLDRMGAGAAQQNLSLAQIGSLKVPIFSEPKQKEFIDFLYNLRGLITVLKDQLEAQYLLKSELQKSILTKTFLNSTDNELVA